MRLSEKTTTHFTERGVDVVISLWKSPALFSFTITSILFSIQLFFIHPFYLVNDDIFKILTVRGMAADPTPSPFVGYSNILMGYLLMKLFAWIPSFPWYGCFLCLVQFLTFWVFLWSLCLKPSRWIHALFFIGAWICLFFIFFTYMQFTETALLAAFVGLIAFFGKSETSNGGRHNGILAAACLLLLLSSFIRMDSFLLALLIFMPRLIFLFKEKGFLEHVPRRRLFLGLTVLGVLFLWASNFFWYQSNKDWAEYRQFDQARVELQDYRISEYSPQTKPYFDSVGWSENDFWLFKNWYYTNPQKFNAETFRKLANFFPRIGSSGKISSHPDLLELFFSPWDFRMMLGFLIFLIFCPRKIWKYLFFQWFWIQLVFLALIYFYRAPDRVTLPITAFLVMLSIFYAEKPPAYQRGESWLFSLKLIILSAIFCFSLASPLYYHRDNLAKRLVQAQLHTFLAMVKPQDNQLYVTWYFPYEELGVFDNLDCLKPFHLFLTEFCQTSPASLKGLERFGVREPLRDAVDNPNVFVMCTQEDGLHYHRYMEENYHQEIYAVPVFKCVHFETYSIHSRKKIHQL